MVLTSLTHDPPPHPHPSLGPQFKFSLRPQKVLFGIAHAVQTCRDIVRKVEAHLEMNPAREMSKATRIF